MTTNILQRRYLLTGIATIAVLGPMRALRAQPAPIFSPEQLDQMLAPIALYPDALLSQTLMAATYPSEVDEAARWSQANPGLRGSDAVNAVAGMDWDVSVKSMVAFPQVLAQMDNHLDWTQNIGDAELAQPGDVSDSIQRLRARAADAGRLANIPYEQVQYLGAGPDRIIEIVPSDPDVVYVPYYNPIWAYGAWPYPAYPPFYYPPLPGYGYSIVAAGFMFGIGLRAGAFLFGGWHWGRGDWRGRGYIDIDDRRVVNIDRHYDISHLRDRHGAWEHDPEHRRGVAYRDVATRERYQPRAGADQRQQFRGRTEATQGSPQGQHPQTSGRIEAARKPQITNVQTQHNQVQTQIQHNQVTGRPEMAHQVNTVQHPPSPPAPAQIQQRTMSYQSQSHTAISGVQRGAQVNHESQRGNQQMQRMAQHSAPRPSPPPPPPPRPAASHPAPQPSKGQKR